MPLRFRFNHLLTGLMTLALPVAAQIPNTLLHSVFGPPSTVVQTGAQLGYSVAMDGNLIVMGAPFDNTGAFHSTINAPGVAKVFDATTGALLHVLVNPEPQNIANFGKGVAVSGTRVCIGAPSTVTGATFVSGKVYVYDLASSTPTLPVLTLSNNSSYSDFGRVVAMSGTRICVGLPGSPGNLGVVLVYDLDSTAQDHWLGFLRSHTATSGANMFGFAVAMSGSRVVVGDFLDNINGQQGTASVFDVSGDFFNGPPPLAVLHRSTAVSGDLFGWSVSIDGTRVAVGAVGVDAGATDAGSVYVFDLSGATPHLPTVTLNNPDPANGDQFGYAIAVSGTRVVVGKHLGDTGAANAGSVYVYDMGGGTPDVPVVTLDNPGPASEENFGFAVAASGTRVAVGAPRDSSAASLAGSGYVYDFGGAPPTAPALTLSDPGTLAGGRAGFSVALSGTRFVVGSPFEDVGAADTGGARVYDLSGGNPSASPLTLTNPIPTTSATFGRSAAMSGERVVVGAPGTSGGGHVFVYDLDNATPATPVLTIANPSPASGDSFGRVAVSGRWLVVGAPGDDTLASNAGSVYVYDLDGPDPSVPVMTLNKPGAVASDSFGSAVAISGMLVIVSAPGDDTGASNAGSAFVFDLAGATPTVPIKVLNNPIPASQDGFGNAVTISDMQVVIGASGDDTGASNAGSVYVYDLGSATPLVPLTLNNPAPNANDGFGSAVAISGTRLVAGAAGNNLAAGSVYVYELASASPEMPVFTLNNPAPFAGDFFGSALALEGGILVVGASGKDTPAYDAGAAFIFGPHPLDQDSDGLLDSWEELYWPGEIALHSPLDDPDHDGIVNLLEMAFGLNPTVPDPGVLTPLTHEGGYLTMTLTKQPGVTYEVQSAGTLMPALPDSFSASTTTVLINNATTLKVRDNTPITTPTARFMRVQVTGAP